MDTAAVAGLPDRSSEALGGAHGVQRAPYLLWTAHARHAVASALSPASSTVATGQAR